MEVWRRMKRGGGVGADKRERSFTPSDFSLSFCRRCHNCAQISMHSSPAIFLPFPQRKRKNIRLLAAKKKRRRKEREKKPLSRFQYSTKEERRKNGTPTVPTPSVLLLLVFPLLKWQLARLFGSIASFARHIDMLSMKCTTFTWVGPHDSKCEYIHTLSSLPRKNGWSWYVWRFTLPVFLIFAYLASRILRRDSYSSLLASVTFSFIGCFSPSPFRRRRRRRRKGGRKEEAFQTACVTQSDEQCQEKNTILRR